MNKLRGGAGKKKKEEAKKKSKKELEEEENEMLKKAQERKKKEEVKLQKQEAENIKQEEEALEEYIESRKEAIKLIVDEQISNFKLTKETIKEEQISSPLIKLAEDNFKKALDLFYKYFNFDYNKITREMILSDYPFQQYTKNIRRDLDKEDKNIENKSDKLKKMNYLLLIQGSAINALKGINKEYLDALGEAIREKIMTLTPEERIEGTKKAKEDLSEIKDKKKILISEINNIIGLFSKQYDNINNTLDTSIKKNKNIKESLDLIKQSIDWLKTHIYQGSLIVNNKTFSDFPFEIDDLVKLIQDYKKNDIEGIAQINDYFNDKITMLRHKISDVLKAKGEEEMIKSNEQTIELKKQSTRSLLRIMIQNKQYIPELQTDPDLMEIYIEEKQKYDDEQEKKQLKQMINKKKELDKKAKEEEQDRIARDKAELRNKRREESLRIEKESLEKKKSKETEEQKRENLIKHNMDILMFNSKLNKKWKHFEDKSYEQYKEIMEQELKEKGKKLLSSKGKVNIIPKEDKDKYLLIQESVKKIRDQAKRLAENNMTLKDDKIKMYQLQQDAKNNTIAKYRNVRDNIRMFENEGDYHGAYEYIDRELTKTPEFLAEWEKMFPKGQAPKFENVEHVGLYPPELKMYDNPIANRLKEQRPELMKQVKPITNIEPTLVELEEPEEVIEESNEPFTEEELNYISEGVSSSSFRPSERVKAERERVQKGKKEGKGFDIRQKFIECLMILIKDMIFELKKN